MLERVPALDRRGVQVQLVHPVFDHYAELGLLDQRGRGDLLRGHIGHHCVDLGAHAGVIVRQLSDHAQDLRQVDALHADAERLQQLFAEARGVEVIRARADGAETGGLHTPDHAAHPGELRQIRLEGIRVGVNRVFGRDAERGVVLVEVVAHRDLAAERVPPPFQVELVQVVRERLHQNRDVQAGELDRLRDALFVAEVRQADQDAVDLAGVLVEQRAALFGVLPRLDRAERGIFRREGHDADTHLVQHGQQAAAAFGDQNIREKVSVANDDAKRDFRRGAHRNLLEPFQAQI